MLGERRGDDVKSKNQKTIPPAIQKVGILDMRFERIFRLKISTDSFALPKEI